MDQKSCELTHEVLPRLTGWENLIIFLHFFFPLTEKMTVRYQEHVSFSTNRGDDVKPTAEL